MREGRLRTVVSIAEIVSALAVVVTLIYAVSELKRSQLLTSSNIETILYDRMLEMDRLVVEADGLPEILARAYADPESLNAVERTRFLAFQHIFYDAWEAAVEAWKSDLMDEETFRSWDDWFAADALHRTRAAWTGNLRYYNGDFVDYVESRVDWER